MESVWFYFNEIYWLPQLRAECRLSDVDRLRFFFVFLFNLFFFFNFKCLIVDSQGECTNRADWPHNVINCDFVIVISMRFKWAIIRPFAERLPQSLWLSWKIIVINMEKHKIKMVNKIIVLNMNIHYSCIHLINQNVCAFSVSFRHSPTTLRHIPECDDWVWLLDGFPSPSSCSCSLSDSSNVIWMKE